jgi:2'-hydroxyisoflavone reductase
MKKLLILGGNRQIGRRLIEILLEANDKNYEIFTFNRGNKTFDILPQNNCIIGDRTKVEDLRQLFKIDWDIVLDCSCYEPFSLKEITQGLVGKVGRYILISTISVYDNDVQSLEYTEIRENSPLKKFTPEILQSVGLLNYAEKKVAAEQVLLESQLEDKVILRPHFIFGKYDYQNLDYYWLDRVRNYNEILIPNDGKDLIHRTYIEDFIQVLQSIFEKSTHQCIYNVTTETPNSLKNYLNTACEILQRKVEFINVPNSILIENKVRPIYDLPFWNDNLCSVFSNTKLNQDFNLSFTPLKNSMQDVLSLDNPNKHWIEGKLGLSREKEEELIKVKKGFGK